MDLRSQVLEHLSCFLRRQVLVRHGHEEFCEQLLGLRMTVHHSHRIQHHVHHERGRASLHHIGEWRADVALRELVAGRTFLFEELLPLFGELFVDTRINPGGCGKWTDAVLKLERRETGRWIDRGGSGWPWRSAG